MTTLLERAQQEGTPLIDGDTVTFVWEGHTAPTLLGDFTHWDWTGDPPPMEEAAPGIWTRTVQLPEDAYLEYIFKTTDGRVLDPLNTRAIPNGIGGDHNFFAMPGFEETPLAEEREDVPHGTVTDVELHDPYFLIGGRRTVHFYAPPVDEPAPLLVVWDGQDYLHRAKLASIVDNLIAEHRIRPIAMAMVDHGNDARAVEYNCSDATIGFLSRGVFPVAHELLNLTPPGDWGVLGASLGGLMSFYTALRGPEVFSRVISQSGAFGADPDDRVINDMVRYFPPRPISFWMDVGRYEPLAGENRRMRALLLQLGYQVTYREYNGAHNYTWWRNEVLRGLEASFPL